MEPSIDPALYPTIVLDGKPYELKFRCGDVIRLKKEKNIDLLEKVELRGIETLERTLELVRAGLAHAGEPFTVEQLADLIDMSQLGEVAELISQALKPRTQAAMTETPSPTVQ